MKKLTMTIYNVYSFQHTIVDKKRFRHLLPSEVSFAHKMLDSLHTFYIKRYMYHHPNYFRAGAWISVIAKEATFCWICWQGEWLSV